MIHMQGAAQSCIITTQNRIYTLVKRLPAGRASFIHNFFYEFKILTLTSNVANTLQNYRTHEKFARPTKFLSRLISIYDVFEIKMIRRVCF